MFDMKKSELHLLISLDTLLDELNVTHAAQRLHIGQSTLSGHLSRLRELFQDPLLVPSETGRGMVPTERALALRPALADALVRLRDAVAQSPNLILEPRQEHSSSQQMTACSRSWHWMSWRR
ncbi:LysR family transcriptional regulator [Paenalcaligenes niemegkensis]|uniref:helix-turn-helix domain-containing protein n=1 Tax=Paenalcaligenes niemegkensis TaxID=2895469 RepID=UPI001EE90CC4|nr:LysR family transcriptional regulator [Paenalcaligenes niemegkensis]MCQ9616536.1 LysR family transcriptional regulator [Paenalcaligenes niemegkensis]